MDGVNSLSDMTASVISILSSIIVKKRGDPKHPFGYGRVEYLSSMLIAMIILLIGIRSIYSSIESIIDPHDPPDYNGLALAIMIISLVSKLIYSFIIDRENRLISFYVTQNSTRNRRICDEELRRFTRQVSDAWPEMQVDIRQGIDT